jgi:DNA-binding response OmpR family regulator
VTGAGRKTTQYDRILVVDPSLAAAKLLAKFLRDLWPTAEVYGAQDAQKAMSLAGQVEPELLFVQAAYLNFDGMAFTRALRRSNLAAREAPVIMVFGEGRSGQIGAAREAGVHEILRWPVSMGELERRLEAVSGRPRDWVEGADYVGPDRRRFNSAGYRGPSRRRVDAGKVQKIAQALGILQSASRRIEAEPVQAARALSTQARVLIELSASHEALRHLAGAATALQGYLQTAAQRDVPPAKDQIETFAALVLQAAPERTRPQAA